MSLRLLVCHTFTSVISIDDAAVCESVFVEKMLHDPVIFMCVYL